jgi:hypothetical protein
MYSKDAQMFNGISNHQKYYTALRVRPCRSRSQVLGNDSYLTATARHCQVNDGLTEYNLHELTEQFTSNDELSSDSSVVNRQKLSQRYF